VMTVRQGLRDKVFARPARGAKYEECRSGRHNRSRIDCAD
jgi:hypothetical protein